MNSKAGMEAVGFLAIGIGGVIMWSAFKNKSAKALFVNTVNPKAGLASDLTGGPYGADAALDANMAGGFGVGQASLNATTVSLGSDAAQQVVAFAMGKVGTPYLYGGLGPGGFDCSGLTMLAYASAGMKLPRVAQAQYEATKNAATQQASPGDLVFYGTAGNIHHVGIALGNGQMVDAPHTGGLVRVEPYHSDLFAITAPLNQHVTTSPGAMV